MSSEGAHGKVLFFLLSGEHPTLPHAELKAVLEAEGFDFTPLGDLRQLSRLICPPSCSTHVAKRASMVRACCLELFSCRASEEDIMSKAREAPFHNLVRPGDTFRVRVRRVRGLSRGLSTLKLERELGAIIFKAVEGAKVDLRNPKHDFLGILTDGHFFFGLKLSEASAKGFVGRRPSKRPFFHPTAMMPKLARCMVNLARAKPGELLLDPFCGTGSIIVEAMLIGCHAVGLDIDKRMCFGCYLNARFFDMEPDGIIVADALNAPIRRADRVATDPPYGRSASTAGREVRELYEGLLSWLPDVLPRGHMACIAAPSDLCVSDMALDAGLKVVETHFFFVHDALTRELAVLAVP